MNIKYSKKEFEGYTHRFIVQFKTDELYDSNMDIYSNSADFQHLEDFINEKKTDKVVSFRITHRASKEQDEMASKLIEETLSGI